MGFELSEEDDWADHFNDQTEVFHLPMSDSMLIVESKQRQWFNFWKSQVIFKNSCFACYYPFWDI